MFGVNASAQGTGFNPFRLIRRVVVLLFTLIQGVLIARILIDVGVIPTENTFSDVVVFWSNFLAAPVQGIGSGLGALFGGGGIEMIAGEGLDAVIVTALVGWTVVENLAMRFFKKLEAV
jgi:hypothetical protein